MSFPAMIKKLREDRNLSQKDVADYLGVTRQAIAAYEVAKREPDYTTLKKLADFFGVSVDYLLGRPYYRDSNAAIIGKNLKLMMGKLTFKQLSEDMTQKTGAAILPEMLELYVKGERMPFMGTVKIFAKYFGVHESFFYKENTYESYAKEKELYSKEMEYDEFCRTLKLNQSALGDLDDSRLAKWIMNKDNLKYIKLARQLEESGISPEVIKSFIESNRNKDK